MSFASTLLFVADRRLPHIEAAEALVASFGYGVLSASTQGEALALLDDAPIDLVLADVDNPDCDAVSLLSGLRFSRPALSRLLLVGEPVCAGLGEMLSRTAAFQYLTKPLEREQAALVFKHALEMRELARRHRHLAREFKIAENARCFTRRAEPDRKVKIAYFERLVYASEEMGELCALAREAARTQLPILIEGETGTGKELLARAVHFHSSRSASPLMVQNCGGMRDELLHSELFGHRRGSFTGAVTDRLGLFRAADGGTVFLDEISEVSPSFQVSLLRFLQEGEVKPLGSDQVKIANVRIIAASNKPLKRLVEAGKFREDLYFRLRGFELEVPPLRARPADIPVLAEFFVGKHGGLLGNRVRGVAEDVLEIFKAYPFPGNVRELENEVRRMIAVAKDGEYLTRRHLSPGLAKLAAKAKGGARDDDKTSNKTLKEIVEGLEAQIVGQVLKKHAWNQSKAARELGLSRVGLANKIRRYALEESRAV